VKQEMMDRFKESMKNSNLTPSEQAAMLAEMNAKITQVNDMIKNEEQAQNEALAELLAKRRAKKSQLREMVDGLAAKKGQVDDYFTKKMDEIADKEKQELAKIEPEIILERKKYLKAI
jgi:Glu-tRNA(Gln) amidotransferase subunit E-like FAD-binding protein